MFRFLTFSSCSRKQACCNCRLESVSCKCSCFNCNNQWTYDAIISTMINTTPLRCKKLPIQDTIGSIPQPQLEVLKNTVEPYTYVHMYRARAPRNLYTVSYSPYNYNGSSEGAQPILLPHCIFSSYCESYATVLTDHIIHWPLFA
jgi:hypothetical protein